MPTDVTDGELYAETDRGAVPPEGVISWEAEDGSAAYASSVTELAASSAFTNAFGGLAAHIADTSGAHAASAVSYNGGTGMSATDVEAAIDELATEKANSSEVLHLAAGGSSVENIGAVESNVNTVAASGSTETLDTSLYGVHDVTMDQNCTFTFSNPAPSGKATVFVLILRGAFTPTWPASVDWPDADQPDYSTPTIYTFMTVDAGTTWYGTSAGKAFG